MSEKTVTIPKSQYRLLCDALINTINMTGRLLAIVPADERSDRALYSAMELRQVIERQLREGAGLTER